MTLVPSQIPDAQASRPTPERRGLSLSCLGLLGLGLFFAVRPTLAAEPASAEAAPAGIGQTAGASSAQPRRIALVIGVSAYENMPELALPTARLDAGRIGQALQTGFGYDQVRVLTDASATYSALEGIFRDQLAREVTRRDTFLLYFVGHGVGGDFGEPRLLLYDTDPDDIDGTSLAVADLATWLQQWVPASRYAVVTDASWGGRVGDRALFGPTGPDWPLLSVDSFLISSSSPRQAAFQGVFARAFLDGLGGRADVDGDLVVTAGELNSFLITAVPAVTDSRQVPTVHPRYSTSLPLSALPRGGGPMRVDRAKFVFQSGTDQKVQCGDGNVVSCDSSCYVLDVPTGACRVSLMAGPTQLFGQVSLAERGLYTCAAESGAVRCGKAR